MKKILIVAVVIFAFALTVNVAFACRGPICPCPDQSNDADNVTITISSDAYTGGNTIDRASISGSGIITGNARSSVRGIIAVNSNFASGDTGRGDYTQENEADRVTAATTSLADTGLNSISRAHVSSGTGISTGSSTSRVSGISLVNTNIRIGCSCTGQPTCGCHHHD